jgi:probable phosphoglycerate mutase
MGELLLARHGETEWSLNGRHTGTSDIPLTQNGRRHARNLAEWDYGDYEGITTAEIHERRPDWTLWRDGCPNGESAADVGARADRLIAEARATEGDVIIFGHGHMLRVIGARWVDLPPEDGGLLGLGTGSLCTLGYEHDLPILVHWNEPGG